MKEENHNMRDFHDTFNIIVGSTNATIDLFDNPYVAINTYEIN